MRKNICVVIIIVFGLATIMFNSGCSHLTKEREWRTIARFDFDKGEIWNISLQETDPGLTWSVIDETGRFVGTTQDTEWIGNRIWLPVFEDTRTKIELSGDFKIAHSDDYQLVALWGMTDDGKIGWGPLCVYFSGRKGEGSYLIQTDWLTLSSKLVQGKDINKRVSADASKDFHTMKIILDREVSEISYYIDDIPLGTIKVDGEIGPITKMMMDIETPDQGTELDIRYDNLRARSSGNPYKK